MSTLRIGMEIQEFVSHYKTTLFYSLGQDLAYDT